MCVCVCVCVCWLSTHCKVHFTPLLTTRNKVYNCTVSHGFRLSIPSEVLRTSLLLTEWNEVYSCTILHGFRISTRSEESLTFLVNKQRLKTKIFWILFRIMTLTTYVKIETIRRVLKSSHFHFYIDTIFIYILY